MPYRDQNNTLYKGSASVVNGEFNFTFVVPKDIAYNYGYGKISYYATTDEVNPIDAGGNDASFLIGGTTDNIVYDYDGPELELFMNTRQFISGGITDSDGLFNINEIPPGDFMVVVEFIGYERGCRALSNSNEDESQDGRKPG